MLEFRLGMLVGVALAAAVLAMPSEVQAQASDQPIRIGYGISQTGGLAPNGKSAFTA